MVCYLWSFTLKENKCIDVYFKVLDDGFIALKDFMGSDADIEQAARVSYGKGTRSVSDTRKLIRYLMSHRHCYHPDMEVLTAQGWKAWKDCDKYEVLLVPNPNNHKLEPCRVTIKKFAGQSKSDKNYIKLHTYKNNRMSYKVTHNHQMWFKNKYQNKFRKYKIQDMSKWGHFEPAANYNFCDYNGEKCPKMQLIGFFLGDGFWSNSNIVFRLKKDRKINYLKTALNQLNLSYQEQVHEGVSTITLPAPRFMLGYIAHTTCANKKITCDYLCFDDKEIRGLFDGLCNSDGSYKQDRDQICFHSTSPYLLNLFETLSFMLGIDCHSVYNEMRKVAYLGNRTSLESRKQYYDREDWEGEVYCATTKSGLLCVRGNSNEFAFICGNSTPFEMAEMKFHIRMPMDAHRQMVRHRTSSINEYSTRYSEAIDSQQVTSSNAWRTQSKTNKQGSSGFVEVYPDKSWDDECEYMGDNTSPGEYLSNREKQFHRNAKELYQERLSFGVAREQARKDLPLSTYTEYYWKCDLRNIMHFLGLRCDSHAQLEIRQYANIMAGIAREVFPLTFEAWLDYQHGAITFSRQEQILLKDLLYSKLDWEFSLNDKNIYNISENLNLNMTKRECAEFCDKLCKEVDENAFDLDWNNLYDINTN